MGISSETREYRGASKDYKTGKFSEKEQPHPLTPSPKGEGEACGERARGNLLPLNVHFPLLSDKKKTTKTT
jgi:hypothetical protein